MLSIQYNIRFGVIDNSIRSYKDKILVGVDPMPKLHIHLVNVIFKYKDMTRIDDKPYEPNVSPHGADKGQKAFFTALVPYIEANKKLDSNTLYNLPENVLLLSILFDFYINVRQYPHSLLYAV